MPAGKCRVGIRPNPGVDAFESCDELSRCADASSRDEPLTETAQPPSMKVEHKIIAAFVIAAVAVVLLGTATYLNVRGLFDRNTWVVHTYRVLGQIDALYDSIDQIESGGRGYLLTNKEAYLQPYQAGIDASSAEIAELRRLTSDNPVQGRNIARLQTFVNRAIAGLHERVALQQAQGPEAVRPLLGTDDKDNMDQIRFTVAAMKNVENRLLASRTSQSMESGHRTLTNFGLLLILALLLLSGFYFFIRHDLADRQRADLALRESDRKFRGVLESAPDAMFITDEKGVIQMVNPQAEKLFGYGRGEFNGRTLGSLLIQRLEAGPGEADADAAGGSPMAERAFRDLRVMSTRYDGVRNGGDLFPVDISRSSLAIGNEHLAISAVRDRSEQEKAEDSLRKFSLDLARSNAELERFAYVASHDLQEPLRMVSSYTQLLAKRYKGKLDGNADEFIGYAVDGANRMQKLINDLLALSRIGTQAKPSEPVRTGEVLRRVLSDLQPSMEGVGATVSQPEAMPTVLADPTQVGQLFQNLIGNAIKFQGAEVPKVTISVQPEEDERFWLFSFRDNGIGIDPQYFDRIFVIFQRLHSKERYAGTGIGLAICKKIVERHGGRLWVESAPGAGANFLFTLPALP